MIATMPAPAGSGRPDRPVDASLHARAFVGQHKPAALALGRAAGELVHDPRELARVLLVGLEGLADPVYHEGQLRIAPGIGPNLGVRQPLLGAVSRGLREAMRHDGASTCLDVADALLRSEILELHWLADDLLERAISDEPERTWQRIRAEAAHASEWITVDSLAKVAARGVLLERYRWAELEQLVYSPSRWERRLVGSTIASLPYVDRRTGREPEVVDRALPILADLTGDAEPDVQKALAWALRSLATVDAVRTAAFLQAEAATARTNDDGHRAWVVRDALPALPAAVSGPIRHQLAAIRRRPGAPSTSRAAATAAAFTGIGVDVAPGERAVVERGR